MQDNTRRNKMQYEWQKNNRERINLLFSRGLKARIQNAAARAGISQSQWVEAAILAALEDGPDGQ